MSYSLKQVLMQRDGMTGIDADLEIKDIKYRVLNGENQERILFHEYRLEPGTFGVFFNQKTFVWDLIFD